MTNPKNLPHSVWPASHVGPPMPKAPLLRPSHLLTFANYQASNYSHTIKHSINAWSSLLILQIHLHFSPLSLWLCKAPSSSWKLLWCLRKSRPLAWHRTIWWWLIPLPVPYVPVMTPARTTGAAAGWWGPGSWVRGELEITEYIMKYTHRAKAEEPGLAIIPLPTRLYPCL